MERNLVAWYEALLKELLPRLHAGTVGSFAEIAALPMDIRGYGPVKEAAVEKVKAKMISLRNRG
jgi:indolepyruvate ferredoxin oxidoreductase